MNKAPIFIIDHDIDDNELMQEAWHEMNVGNKLVFFKNAEDALHHLQTKTEVPFLIICEMNLPTMSGFELKKHLMEHNDTNFKSIPFVFLSASPSQKQVELAYHLCSNGVFVKQHNFEQFKQQLIDISKYWATSLVPINPHP